MALYCFYIGNAYEYGHQRGTVIHSTHLARVEQDVYNDIRGANIYVEDRNEMYNRILYNVGICPWPNTKEKKMDALFQVLIMTKQTHRSIR